MLYAIWYALHFKKGEKHPWRCVTFSKVADFNFTKTSVSTLLKESKRSYYKNYFRSNINNIKNSWKGIKSIISLNTKEPESPKIVLNNKGEFLSNANDIANQFNNFFCSVAPTIQSNKTQILNLLIII